MIGTILGAAAIGLTLGLLGSGGSILTVPILKYGLGHPEKAAFAEGMAIVALIAFGAAVPFARAGSIDWRSVIWFGLPGVAGTYLGAWLSGFLSGALLLVLLAAVMLLAAILMFRETERAAIKREAGSEPPRRKVPRWKIAGEGLLVGVVTGLISVGGGFLIVPALVLLGGLPMRQAVGTSLIIIGLKSVSGFAKHYSIAMSLHLSLDWNSIVWFALVGIVGSLAGSRLNARLNQRWLKRLFAGFLLVMALFILVQEAPRVFAGAGSERELPAGTVGSQN